MANKSFRVYFIAHTTGLMTGIMMRAKRRFPDTPPPSAIGSSEEDVYRQLEVILVSFEVTETDTVDRYLWDETFEAQDVAFEVHPQTAVEKRHVIGSKKIPLRMTYVHSKLATGGFRVMLPRFGWWFILEELALAKSVLVNALSTALLGENPRGIYEFRREGEEYVREWNPRMLQRGGRNKEEDDNAARRSPVLDTIAEDLVDKASRGKLGLIVGDSIELDRAKPLVERLPPPSLLLVGGPGVGKSTWVRRLARQLLIRRREATSKDAANLVPRLWSTSADRILAGMTYLGMWQKRCLDLVAELDHEGDWLYVDRLVPILEPQSDGTSIADILGPAILAGDVSLIAECSEEELERCQRRFATLVSTFQIIRFDEAPAHRMPELFALYQARKSGPSIHAAGLKRLVVHLTSFQKDQRFPGKGFRFLDWLAASAETTTTTTTTTAQSARQLYPTDVSEAYARFSGLPLEILSDDKVASPDALVLALKKGVIGQDNACATAARVLARLKAGLVDPEKPAGTLLFVGPTGVGKTELAKQLARFLFHDEARMVRVDMSEYMLQGSAQRLLWAADGAESLAQRVRAQPLSVVLFDEIEKAHHEVFDLLLGVLGEGRLTDSFGRLVDFRMTVLVMTSNLGVTETRAAGFEEGTGDDFVRHVREHFRPELFNRIDHVIPFRRLSPADVHAIVLLEIDKIKKRTGLVRKNLELRVEPAARERLAELGWHPTRGARPLKRVLEERVVSPLAALLARDPSIHDRTLVVAVNAEGAIEIRA